MAQLDVFVAELTTCQRADQAVELLLSTLLGLAEETLRVSHWGRTGRMLRGAVHFRASDGYRALRSKSVDGSDLDLQDLIASTTASQWVEQTSGAVAIDVLAAELTPFSEAGEVGQREQIPERYDGPSEQSAMALLRHGTTHVMALPLRAAGGRISGMLTLEGECREAMDDLFIWPRIREQAQMFADIAAPHVFTLPLGTDRPMTADRLMPVIGENMAVLLETLRQFSQTSESILLQGPTGSGKSRLARWCHMRSPRKAGPFIEADLTSMPEDLQLPELFGWKKGAFTSAVSDQPGLVAKAEGGTLFLDEIDKLSLKAQAGLLGFLETHRYRVLGDTRAADRTANVVVFCASNIDFKTAVAEGAFREDLYYRINVLPVRLPGLDQRRDEIGDWATYFCRERHTERGGSGTSHVAPEAVSLLERRSWPGNLRQLKHVVRRAYALALVDQPAQAPDVLLRADHVAAALAHEVDGLEEGESPMRQLQIMADQLVEMMRDSDSASEVLDLAGPVMRALMLHTANEQEGNLSQAYQALGKDKVVQSRNHQRLYRQDHERLRSWCELVGEPIPEFAK